MGKLALSTEACSHLPSPVAPDKQISCTGKRQYKLCPLQINRICLSDGAQYQHTKMFVYPWALSPAWYCALGHSVSYCNQLPRPPSEF